MPPLLLPPNDALPDLDWLPNFSLEWLWLILGFFGFLSVIYFLVILYHWLRYETSSGFTAIVLLANALVLILLLGGATTTLVSYLNI